jgi:hypothetical protein
MAITCRGDPAPRGHVDAPEEPVPLTVVCPPNVRPRPVRLVPPEDRLESTWLASHEANLRRAYDIGPSVNIFFQEPGSLGIAGGEVTLTERMLMAGVRLPFPRIVREVCTFLGVAPGQIAPNGWRYEVASSILWRQVLGTEMDAAQFFSIYRPSTKDGAVELRVHQDPIFIYLDQRKYGNNKGWRQQFFRVSGEWECPSQSAIPDTQRVPREWRPLVNDLRILPTLSIAKVKEVNAMLSFSARAVQSSIDYENLVSVQSLNECFGYQIPERKIILDKRGAPIAGWSVTTSRPIPSKVPKKAAQKGNPSGRQADQSSMRTRASKVNHPQAPASRAPEASDSSIGSDDSIMREIDEVVEASSEGEEGNSSPAVTILPRDHRAGPPSPGLNARSPPISFEDVAEDMVTAAVLIEVVGCSIVSPVEPNPYSEKQKGKRVASETDEGPEPKRLRAQRDSGFMVDRILAMAKVYAPPSSRDPPMATSLPAPTTPVPSSDDPVDCPEAEPTFSIEVIEGDEVLPGRSPTHSLLGEDQDTFSQEFNKLQEEVASKREALEQASPTPISPMRPESPASVSAHAVPRTSTSASPTIPIITGRRLDFQTEGLTGCPLEALSSLVTSDYSPQFGQLPVEGYDEQLTGKILQVRGLTIST